MPSISVEGEVFELVASTEMVESLEQCVINWLSQISSALESQLKKTPQVTCPGPAAHQPKEGLQESRCLSQCATPLNDAGGTRAVSLDCFLCISDM